MVFGLHWTEILALVIVVGASVPVLLLFWTLTRIGWAAVTHGPKEVAEEGPAPDHEDTDLLPDVGGETANHRPSRGIFFWALSPFFLALAILLPILIDTWTPGAVIVTVVMEILCLLVLAGLFDAQRFWWAWRGVGAIVFLGYATYVIAMLIEQKFLSDHKSQPSVLNAMLGLAALGLPGLWFALFGRFTLRRETSDDAMDDQRESDSH